VGWMIIINVDAYVYALCMYICMYGCRCKQLRSCSRRSICMGIGIERVWRAGRGSTWEIRAAKKKKRI